MKMNMPADYLTPRNGKLSAAKNGNIRARNIEFFLQQKRAKAGLKNRPIVIL